MTRHKVDVGQSSFLQKKDGNSDVGQLDILKKPKAGASLRLGICLDSEEVEPTATPTSSFTLHTVAC